jgi:acetylornithine/N-succinyldiaminopimelate aminotransferase
MAITPLMPVYPRCEFRPVRGEGAWLIGEDGRRALDFASGIAVNILGHSHPGLIKAIQHQAETVMHVSNLYGSPQGDAFAQRLIDTTFADTVFFTNSGAEAVECAMKTARAYHQSQGSDRFEIITFKNAFHGRTMGTISASDQEKMHKGFLPVLPGFHYVDFNDLDGVKAAIGAKTAAIMLEPIQGEAGVKEATPEFLKGLRELCDEHDLLLIFDEVQCGVARTGTLYYYEQTEVVPDILTTAKGIGGGFPLGACLATEKAARGMTIGTHGSTYGGNPFAMAAGQAVWDAVANDEFMNNVRMMGDKLRSSIEQFIGNYPNLFTGVRGVGLMLGVQMTQEVRDFVGHCREKHGLLLVSATDKTFRVLPPLNIDESHIVTFMEKLSAAAADYGPLSAAA